MIILPSVFAALLCFLCAGCGALVGFMNLDAGRMTFAKWQLSLSALLMVIGIASIVQAVWIYRNAQRRLEP